MLSYGPDVKTAKALELTVPQSILLSADEVYPMTNRREFITGLGRRGRSRPGGAGDRFPRFPVR